MSKQLKPKAKDDFFGGDEPKSRAPAKAASRAILEAVFESVRAGVKTADLGGKASTGQFTKAVIDELHNAEMKATEAVPA